MRKSLTIICLFFALFCLAEEHVTWISKVHDFGAFDEDTKKKTAQFSFVNTTSTPVTVVSATATCGCTVPEYDQDEIAPGDTSIITVSYDPSGRPGRFDKQIYVRTSDSYDRTKLVIKGTVIGNPETINGRYPMSMGPLKLRNGAAMLGKASAGHTKMHYIDGYNMSLDTISPVMIAGPDWIEMHSTPERVAPGDMLSLDLTFKGDKCPLWGVVTDSISIAPVPGGDSYILPLIVIVEEDFSYLNPKQRQDAPIAALSSDRVVLPAIEDGETKTVSSDLILTNRGKNPLVVRRIYSEDPGVAVDISADEIHHKKSAEIKVSFDSSVQPTGIINARITLITNDPVNPTQVLRVVGERK